MSQNAKRLEKSCFTSSVKARNLLSGYMKKKNSSKRSVECMGSLVKVPLSLASNASILSYAMLYRIYVPIFITLPSMLFK